MRGIVFGVVAGLALAAGTARAQQIGIQLDWSDDADVGLGVRLEAGLPNVFSTTGPMSRTYFIGSFDYFFPDNDNINYWEINANLAVPLVATGIDPYVGAGLNLAHVSVDNLPGASDTDLGLNLLGGLRFDLGTLGAFTEARVELGGGDSFVLAFGLMLGGRR